MTKALKDAETREMEKENKELLGAMGRLGQKHTGLAASNVLVLSAPVRNYPPHIIIFLLVLELYRAAWWASLIHSLRGPALGKTAGRTPLPAICIRPSDLLASPAKSLVV